MYNVVNQLSYAAKCQIRFANFVSRLAVPRKRQHVLVKDQMVKHETDKIKPTLILLSVTLKGIRQEGYLSLFLFVLFIKTDKIKLGAIRLEGHLLYFCLYCLILILISISNLFFETELGLYLHIIISEKQYICVYKIVFNLHSRTKLISKTRSLVYVFILFSTKTYVTIYSLLFWYANSDVIMSFETSLN